MKEMQWGGTAFLSHNISLSGGTAILFSKAFLAITRTVVKVLKGRLLKVRAVFGEHVFVFVSSWDKGIPYKDMEVEMFECGDALISSLVFQHGILAILISSLHCKEPVMKKIILSLIYDVQKHIMVCLRL